MGRLDYRQVPDRGRPRVPVVSEGISLFSGRGAFRGDYIRDFVYRELLALGVKTFAHLRRDDDKADRNLGSHQRYKLVVMATDITEGRLLRLPCDYWKINRDPDKQLVADAVRASISIPLYFKPVILRDPGSGKKTDLVDGGVLSNFPIEIFDRTDGGERRWPTLGVKVMPPLPVSSEQLFPTSPGQSSRRSV